MNHSEDPALARAALRAAAHLEMRPFLTAALEGALSVCGAASGGIYLARIAAVAGSPKDGVRESRESTESMAEPIESAEERGRGGNSDEGSVDILVTAPSGQPGIKRYFSLHDLRLVDSNVADAGERLSGRRIEGRTKEPPPEELLAVPLHTEGGRAGLLLLLPREGTPGFPDDALDRCRAYASLLSPLLANVLRVRDLEDTVLRDDMAECYNRRYLEEFLAQETARARRFRKPVSLIFLDMDDLKAVNSAHGHGAGSEALREVARRVNATTRRIDKVFRFGGDEFCIVLPETDLNGARRVAERVRGTIAGARMLRDEIPAGVSLTASLGIATFPVHASTGEAMLTAADAAMRRIKRTGKNAISVADPCFPWEDEPVSGEAS